MSSSEDGGSYPGPDALSTDPVQSVARSAAIVGAATFGSRVLGLLRDVVLAACFTQGATDTFFIAFMIPNLFRRLVGEGALTVSFVPIFTGWLRRSREEARRFFNATWTLNALLGSVICIAGISFADPLVSLFAPGFAADPGKHELCVALLRLCFPYILLLMLVAVAMGALNAAGHFLTPALAPVLLNLCLIAAALGAGGALDPPILALGVAVIVAGILQVALQVPALRARELAPRPVFAPRHPAILRLARLMAPALLGASVFQLNVLVSRLLASFAGEGAVSNLYYADRLIEFPLGVFVFAIGTASLPAFSRLVKDGDRAGLSRSLSSALALALGLAIPSAIGLWVLRIPIVGMLFSWNDSVFGAAAVAGCAQALGLYALGLVPITVARTYVNLCMAHENTRVPAQAAVVSLGVNVLCALALIGPLPEGSLSPELLALQHAWVWADLGYPGLALASSIASLANAVYLIVVSQRLYGNLFSRRDLGRWGRLMVAGLGMGGGVWLLARALAFPASASPAGLALLGLTVGGGGLLYLGLLRLLRSPEYAAILGLLRPGKIATPTHVSR